MNIEAVVVGDFQGDPINGFFVQEEDSGQDGNPATSEGLFIFEGALAVPVAAGNLVRVRGQVAEFDSLTELTGVTDIIVCPGAPLASTQALSFPVPAVADLERLEGMAVHIAQPLTVTGNFELGRFGSLDLSVGGRLYQPTQLVAPGAPAVAQQDLNSRSRIVLDDLSTLQNPNPIPYMDGQNTRRLGDTLPSLSGILDGRFGVYRIQPTGLLSFSAGNPRPATPAAVGGRLRVVGFNVLNYFTTLDTGTPACGPMGTLDCRGANTALEFNRQRTKLLNALELLAADVLGVTELENNASASAQDLVDGLNARVGAGTYAFVNTGTIGTDAIKAGLLYKPAKVTPTGAFALLTSAVDPSFIDTKNRPALAQTFTEVGTGAAFTVVVVHLKSKGSACDDVGDPDTGDGQGNCNGTRTSAAAALRNWMAAQPTGNSDPDFLVIGDINAYAKENPVSTMEAGGFQSLAETFVGLERLLLPVFRSVRHARLRDGQRDPGAPGDRRDHLVHQRRRARRARLQYRVQDARPLQHQRCVQGVGPRCGGRWHQPHDPRGRPRQQPRQPPGPRLPAARPRPHAPGCQSAANEGLTITAGGPAPRAAGSCVPAGAPRSSSPWERVSSARIHHVNRSRGRVPVAKDALEPAGTQVRHADERGKQRDAQAGGRDLVQNVHVGHHQARGQADLR